VEGDWGYKKPFKKEELEFKTNLVKYKKEGYQVDISRSPHVFFNEINSYQSLIEPEATPELEREAQLVVRTPNDCPYYITSKSKKYNGTLEEAIKNIERELNEMPYGYDHVTHEIRKIENTALEAYLVD